jgi:uncharacterized surface protein with fasciclin (FAS1) repeats
MNSTIIEQRDIVETVSSFSELSTFASVLDTAEYSEILREEGPYTIFAPIDDAFFDLPVGTLEYLLRPQNRRILMCILKYHIIQGKIPAEDVANLKEIRTANGEMLRITSKYGKTMVDRATIMQSNIECSNGIIHIIDLLAVPKRWI